MEKLMKIMEKKNETIHRVRVQRRQDDRDLMDKVRDYQEKENEKHQAVQTIRMKQMEGKEESL